MSDVFLSYAHSDSCHADHIAAVLDELGIAYFRDVKDIQWGQRLSTSVRKGLESARAIIVLVSPGSCKSQWVAYEVGFSSAREIRILPYLVHPDVDVPGFMSDLLHVKSKEEVRRFFSERPIPLTLESAAAACTGHRRVLTELQLDYLKDISRPRNEGSICGAIDDEAGREVAPYQEALEAFQDLNLVRYSSGRYVLTQNGWQLADQLWQLSILESLSVEQYLHESLLGTKVTLTDGETELEELRRHISELKTRGLVNSIRSSSGMDIVLTYQGATYRKRPIEY